MTDEPPQDEICPRFTQRGTKCRYRKASYGDGYRTEYAPACSTHMWDHENALFRAAELAWRAGQASAAYRWSAKLKKVIEERDEALLRYHELADRYDQLRRKAPG